MENKDTIYPRASIVILNWNGLEDTIECLESLKKITYPNYDVIVIDNGSSGNDAEILQSRFADYIHLIKNDKNLGFAGGVNVGIKYAQDNYKPEFLILLNNDTVVTDDFLTKMVELAITDNSIGMVGAEIYEFGYPVITRGVGDKMRRWITYIGIKQIDVWHPDRGQFTGSCLFIKKDVIEKIGFFDESYFAYWEDLDFEVRAKAVGYRTARASEAKICHKASQSTRRVSGLGCYYSHRNKIRFMRKHATKWQYSWFIIYNLLFFFELQIAYYLILKRSPQNFIAYFRGVRDGLLNHDTAARLYCDNRFQD